jgi:glutaredoxin
MSGLNPVVYRPGNRRGGNKSMASKRILMYTRTGCEDSDAAREFLRAHHIQFEEVNIEENQEAMGLVRSVNEGKQRTPTFNVEDRVFHCSHFDPQTLARELGLLNAGQSKPQ